MQEQSKKDPRKVVLVTGCGSGLGLSLARKLATMEEYRVVVTARGQSLEKLRERLVETDRFLLRELDVLNGAQIHALVNEVSVLFGGIDILVNNAGVCFRSVVEHMDVESEMTQLKTNYLGPMTLVRALLPIMREQGSGQIINVSSVSGIVAMPTMGSYAASKHALEGASEALWYEARPFGIKVTCVQPGFIRSDAYQHVQLSKKAQVSAQLLGPHSEYYASMTPMIEKFMMASMSDPDKIASRIVKLFTMKDPPLRVSVTADAWLFRWLRWVLPFGLFHKMMFQILPGSHSWGADRPTRRLRPVRAKG